MFLVSTSFANPYEFSWKQELSFLAVGTGLSVTGLIADSEKKAPNRVTLKSLNKNDIFLIDQQTAGNWNSSARKQSDILLYTSLILPLSIPLAHQNQLANIALLYGETVLLTFGGTTMAKGLVDRYRPYTYNSSAPDDYLFSIDAKRSFFSGHAAHITASSVFFAKVFGDLNPQSRYIPAVWTGAGILSAFGGILRVEAGMHFPSDVIAGWLWGGLMGYWVPQLHHKNSKLKIFPLVSNDATGLNLQLKF